MVAALTGMLGGDLKDGTAREMDGVRQGRSQVPVLPSVIMLCVKIWLDAKLW